MCSRSGNDPGHHVHRVVENFVLLFDNRFLPDGRHSIPSRHLFQTFIFVVKTRRQCLVVRYLFQANRRRPLPGNVNVTPKLSFSV